MEKKKGQTDRKKERTIKCATIGGGKDVRLRLCTALSCCFPGCTAHIFTFELVLLTVCNFPQRLFNVLSISNFLGSPLQLWLTLTISYDNVSEASYRNCGPVLLSSRPYSEILIEISWTIKLEFCMCVTNILWRRPWPAASFNNTQAPLNHGRSDFWVSLQL